MATSRAEILDYESAAKPPRNTWAARRIVAAYVLGGLASTWVWMYPSLVYHGSDSMWFARTPGGWEEYVALRIAKFAAMGLAAYGIVCVTVVAQARDGAKASHVVALLLNVLALLCLATMNPYGER